MEFIFYYCAVIRNKQKIIQATAVFTLLFFFIFIISILLFIDLRTYGR